jgi:hypothetical protein
LGSFEDLSLHMDREATLFYTSDHRHNNIFTVGRWSKPTTEELCQMHRSEAQLWLCLRQLLLEPRLGHHYSVDETRRNIFCRVSNEELDGRGS